MTLKTSLLALLLAVATLASAKKLELPIEIIASQAEYIVVGEIVSVQASTYQFHVAKYVKGSGSSTVTVQQFEEWTCDVRYAKAAKGQRLVLFLQKHKGALELINGSSGELPILNNKVTLKNETYAYQYGKPFVPYSIPLPEFATGLKKFVRYFTIPTDPNARFSFAPRAIVQVGSTKEVKAFRATSKFAGWLYERITSRYIIAKA
ncbi:hypothetical protein [Hymenobacter crusticola]|uniref:DUF4468 domain-containing protein n=1 Tax=Hymenobacter crusticola TaxID=1770526 RepID=A0A2C9ZV59_9BACT|nr:hypothetical protein [Hymenobacter crusticola]OUJ70419.1 hypothetical protein BXP70_23930 [Hymenobacter crusticola]